MEKGNKKFPSFPAIVQCFAYKIKSESFSVLNGDIVMLNDFFMVKETIDFANKENLDVVIQDSTVSTFPEAVVLLTQKGYKCKTC